jgi:hypothetical protein
VVLRRPKRLTHGRRGPLPASFLLAVTKDKVHAFKYGERARTSGSERRSRCSTVTRYGSGASARGTSSNSL